MAKERTVKDISIKEWIFTFLLFAFLGLIIHLYYKRQSEILESNYSYTLCYKIRHWNSNSYSTYCYIDNKILKHRGRSKINCLKEYLPNNFPFVLKYCPDNYDNASIEFNIFPNEYFINSDTTIEIKSIVYKKTMEGSEFLRKFNFVCDYGFISKFQHNEKNYNAYRILVNENGKNINIGDSCIIKFKKNNPNIAVIKFENDENY